MRITPLYLERINRHWYEMSFLMGWQRGEEGRVERNKELEREGKRTY